MIIWIFLALIGGVLTGAYFLDKKKEQYNNKNLENIANQSQGETISKIKTHHGLWGDGGGGGNGDGGGGV